MKLDFKGGTGHFFLMVRREGNAEGSGPLAGAAVTEFGAHDITPGVGGEPRGYLVFTIPAGDEAYVKWSVQGTFVAGEGGKPKLLDNGVWQLNGGTGHFKGLHSSAGNSSFTFDGGDWKMVLIGSLAPFEGTPTWRCASPRGRY